MVMPAFSIPSMDQGSLLEISIIVSHSACALTLWLQGLMVPAALTNHLHLRSWCHRSLYWSMPLHRHRNRRCHQIHHHRDCDFLPQQTINPSAAWLFKAMLYKQGFLVHGPSVQRNLNRN